MVSFVKIRKDTINSMKQAILESLELIDYSFGKGIKNVVIKPNLCYYWDYTTGQTTDPNFVAALINVIREKISSKANIRVVESDASAMKCKHAFRMLGYEKLAQEHDVDLINLSRDSSNAKKIEIAGERFGIKVPSTIENADLKINIPKIKYTFEEVKITCALKNIFGCNPYPKKFKYHPKIEEVIVAINKAMRFNLCIVDGNIVSGVQPRRLGLVMAGEDPVAVDAAAADIAGVNPKTIRYIQLAHKEGLGDTCFVQKGTPSSYFKARYPGKGVRNRLISRMYSLAIRVLGERLEQG